MNRQTLPNDIPIYEMPFGEGEERSPIRIVAAGNSPFIKNKIWLAPHRKNYFLLQYVTKGQGRHWVDMIPYEFRPNILYFSSPEQIHVKDDVKLYGTVITFTKEFLSLEENCTLGKLPLLQNLQNAHELKIGPEEKAEFEELLNKCLTEFNGNTYLHKEMLYTYVRTLLIYLSRLYNVQYDEKQPNIGRDLYRTFQFCVEENYKDKHGSQQYASMLKISVSHLNALIREQSGKTVMLHVHERLILEAKRMLCNTSASVKQIAFSLGYNDTSYFNRFFKKVTGITPVTYRQMETQPGKGGYSS
jgi:AraC family transcriptional activator of pobA